MHTQDARIFCCTRLEVVVVGSLFRGMSMTVVMPPAAAAFVAVSMPAPQQFPPHLLLPRHASWDQELWQAQPG